MQQHIYIYKKNSISALSHMMTKYEYKINCMHHCQKYLQELTICAKQNKHVPLTKCHYSVQIMDAISFKYFDKFNFYSFGSSQDFIFIYMGVHVVDPEIERDPGSPKFENYWSKQKGKSSSQDY